MAFRVFLSYSTKDNRVVSQVQSALSGLPLKMFVADHSVEPGESLPDRILSAIRECDLFVVLWSKNSKSSGWVSQEVGAARAAGKKVLPLLLNPGLELPAFMSSLKYLSVHDEPEQALVWFRENVQSRVERKRQSQLLGWGALGFLALLALASRGEEEEDEE